MRTFRKALFLAFSALIIVVLAGLLSGVPPVARADALTVINTDDSGAGSLRQAIADAAPGDTILFDGSLTGQTITLTAQLEITKNLTIDGSGLSAPINVSGNDAVRVFTVTNNAQVTFNHVTIERGRDTSAECDGQSCGGGLKIDAGAVVTLTHSAVLDNSAHSGGGIRNDGVLTLQNSTLSGNSAGWDGGGLLNNGTATVANSTLSGNSASFGGGIRNSAVLTLQNSTLSGNSATYDGGGVYNNDTLTAQNISLSGNSAGRTGGGICNSGTLNYQNTLIANSPSGGDCSNNGAIGANIRNLVEDGSCSAALSGDPLLGPLADNGGDTLTHDVLSNSPAIEAGDDATCLPTDQRGVPRPYPAGGHCDIGAVEKMWSLRLTKAVTPTTNVAYHSLVTYTLVLKNASGTPDPGVWLTDTLPAEVNFAGWIISPTNTTLVSGEIRWHDALQAGQAITFSFQAKHTGEYGDHVVNLAQFSGATGSGNAHAAFDVECALSITVQNANDSGLGSLRQAIAGACPGDTIVFDGSLAGQTITLTTQLEIAKNLTIDGSGLGAPIHISGNDAVRVFQVASGAHVTLERLTIAHGYGDNGGGIYIESGAAVTLTHSAVLSSTASNRGGGIYIWSGALIVQDSILSGNSASSLGGGGGGIYNNLGTLTVRNSTLSGNSAYDGGGIYNASGPGGSVATVENSTLSGNSASSDGGGIYNETVATIRNSTLSGNSASSQGGGIYNVGGQLESVLNYQNTLIVNSLSGGDCYIGGTIVTNIHNLVEDGTCLAALSGDPLLGPLADNGGDTLTHMLLDGSPAINAGDDAACLPTDQRGVQRPLGSHCDIGAVEFGAPPKLSLVKSVTPDSDVLYHDVVTYTLALTNTGYISDNVTLMDTLPTRVAFERWLALPAGNLVQNSQAFTWTGELSPCTAITFAFTTIYTGKSAEAVTNLASFSGTWQTGGSAATFMIANYSPPHAVDDAYSTPQGTPLIVLDPADGVLANDDDPDGNSLTAELLAPPAHGYGGVKPGGNLAYIPDPGFIGTDVFTYIASDGELIDTASVVITVTSSDAHYADPAGICDGNTPCYTTVQAAIDALQLWTGRRVYVYGGTYAESVALNQNVTVTLLDDATLTGGLTLALGNFDLDGHTLMLGGDFNNSAVFNAGTGTLILNGSTLQTIGGVGVTTFHNLTIANTSGLDPAVKLKTDAVVNGALTLQSGALGIFAETFTLNGPVATVSGRMARLLSTTTYAQAAPGQSVAPGQHGHLVFNDQPKALPGGGAVNIEGDFDPGAAGGHAVAGSTVAFNGAGVQTIANDVALNNLTVGEGVTLTTAAHVGVGGALNNAGWTRETRDVAGAGVLAFGLADVAVDVTTLGSLSSLEVIRRDQDHPNAASLLQTGKYWTITPSEEAVGFTATLTAPYGSLASPMLCFYPGAASGVDWDCAGGVDNHDGTITRNNVTHFSDWAVGASFPIGGVTEPLSLPPSWLWPVAAVAVAALARERWFQVNGHVADILKNAKNSAQNRKGDLC